MKRQKARYKRFTRSRFGNVLYFLFLIIAGLFTILPLIYSVVTSFKPLDELLAFPPKFFVVRPTLKNYVALPELLSNLEVPLSRYVINTLFVTFSITFLQVIVSCMAAYVTCQVKNRATKLLFMIIQFALLYNGTTLAVPQYLIFCKIGIIDSYWAYILPALASTMGVFLVKQFMESSIPEVLIEASRIDGAGAGRRNACPNYRNIFPLSLFRLRRRQRNHRLLLCPYVERAFSLPLYAGNNCLPVSRTYRKGHRDAPDAKID